MLKKITESDINGLGVVGLADTPGLSATDMQEKFEEISKSAIIPKFNQLIDDLEALNIYHKVDSVEGKALSTNDYTNEDKEALYSTKGKIDETVKIFGKASIDFGRKPNTDKGDKSTALGSDNTASGNYSDALGQDNISSGLASHSEGANNISSGKYSHAEGNKNEATKDYAHAEGYNTKATGVASHAEGDHTTAGAYSHAEGYLTAAMDFSHSEGDSTTASGVGSHSEGSETQAIGLNSHSEGKLTVASGKYSHAEGNTTKAIANNSHAEGIFTKVDLSGENGHAEGYGSIVTGESSHAEGINTKAEGNHSHAEGSNTTAKGSGSHAEGAGTVSEGENSHTEGSYTTASGNYSHSEGASSQASGSSSHAEGAGTVASGDYSHAEGSGTRAKGSNAHAEGGATIATGEFQHVQGKFNEEDADGIYAHIVGGGTSDTDRKNIHTIDWQGNAEFAGNVTDGYGNSMSLLKTESGHSLELNIDENYIMTISLLNKSGETISSKAIDFPIESMVVNASYSSGKLTLILQNGNMVDVDVSAIVKGLVNESRTIAGIDLKDDITADELIAALGIDTIKEDVAQLKGDLTNFTGNEEIKDFNINYYIKLDGSTTDFTLIKSNFRKCVIVDCNGGEVFYIKGTGSTSGRLYAFAKDDGTILESAYANQTYDGHIQAPKDATKLIVNFDTYDVNAERKLIRKYILVSKVEANEKRLNISFYELTKVKPFEYNGVSSTNETVKYDYYFRKGESYKITNKSDAYIEVALRNYTDNYRSLITVKTESGKIKNNVYVYRFEPNKSIIITPENEDSYFIEVIYHSVIQGISISKEDCLQELIEKYNYNYNHDVLLTEHDAEISTGDKEYILYNVDGAQIPPCKIRITLKSNGNLGQNNAEIYFRDTKNNIVEDTISLGDYDFSKGYVYEKEISLPVARLRLVLSNVTSSNTMHIKVELLFSYPKYLIGECDNSYIPYMMTYTKGDHGGISNVGKVMCGISYDGSVWKDIQSDCILKTENFAHDPCIIFKDEYYYMIGTTNGDLTTGANITIYKSLNLTEWSIHSVINIPYNSVYIENVETESIMSVWAPEILLIDGVYYLSYSVCTAFDDTNKIVRSYIAKFTDSSLQEITNIKKIIIDNNTKDFSYDATFIKDGEYYYGMTQTSIIYRTTDLYSDSWEKIGSVPLYPLGYWYMEAPTIIKIGNLYHIWGDGTRMSDRKTNNLLHFVTPDFKNYVKYEVANVCNEEYVRHAKIIKLNGVNAKIPEKVFLNSI